MKVNVTIAGASYSEVPSILIPLKNGGRARFCEVSDTTAKASDVAQGKTFYDADGNYTEGTVREAAAQRQKRHHTESPSNRCRIRLSR